MLTLNDFNHLPEIDQYIEEMVQNPKGLMVIAGLGLRTVPTQYQAGIFQPSGRSTIFQIIFHEILKRNPLQAIVIAQDKETIHIPSQSKKNCTFRLVDNQFSYEEWIHQACDQAVDLIVLDRINSQTAPLIPLAIQSGIPVISQIDTILWGKQIVLQLIDLGFPREFIDQLRWILTVQRLPALCPSCKGQVQLSEDLLQRLKSESVGRSRYLSPGLTIYKEGSCEKCHSSGRYGEATLYDIYQGDPYLEKESEFKLEDYLDYLIITGELSLNDRFSLQPNQLRHVFNLLASNEDRVLSADRSLQTKLAELKAANRVLQQRTEVLIALQEFGQALISSTDLNNLARIVCTKINDLCGADRSILYLHKVIAGREVAQVLAFNGWEGSVITPEMEAFEVFEDADTSIHPYGLLPPGVHSTNPKISNADLRFSLQTGLRLPLISQGELVGLMIVHSLRKKTFKPGEVALLETFANQSAMALQRAGLIEQLQRKIEELQLAQIEIQKKERLDRELEVARQMQQSMLPKSFPEIPDYNFGVINRPARQVGGDFYDIISLDPDHFGIVIADVSDKGLPASLYMALTRSLIVAEAHRDLSPKQVLENVNSLLIELANADNFVSVFYGVIQISNNSFRYTRAGHEYPFLIRKGEITLLKGSGAVLGIIDTPDLRLSEEEIILQPDDRLILYTDGIADTINSENQVFGIDRLKAILLGMKISNPKQGIDLIMDSLSDFQGKAEQFDDVTIMIVDHRDRGN
jgi:serine phosphatase RsbU (regulator of sigma subunit)